MLNDSTSSVSISSSLPSIPSISTNAPVPAPKVLIPRIQKLEIFFPGSPELCIVMTPAIRPPIILLREVAGVFNCATSIVVIAPTTETFFCELIPVTTTSSILVSSSFMTILSFSSSLVISISTFFIPTDWNTNVAFFVTLILNFPSKSATTPTPGSFFT